MYLLGHNANMTLIQAPGIPADPAKNISGSGPTTRWTGIAQAYIDEDIIDQVRGAQLVQFSQTTLDLPANIPIWPGEEDLVTIVRTGIVARFSDQGPQTEVLKIRKTDGGLLMLGRVRFVVVRA